MIQKYGRYILFCYHQYDNVPPFENAVYSTNDIDDAINHFNNTIGGIGWSCLFDCDDRKIIRINEPSL